MSSSNGYATRDQFFELPTRRFKDVVVAGLKFRIRSLTEGEWANQQMATWDYENGGRDLDGVKSSDARLIVACVVDGNGEQIFKDTDVPRLAFSDAGFVEPLVREVRRHCGLAGVEEAKKNSSTTGGDDSDSSSSAASADSQPATA